MHSLIIDCVMITLLIGVMFYSWKMGRKLKALRSISHEMSPVLQDLSKVLAQTQINLAQLRTTAKDIEAELNKKLPEAESIRDDLTMLVEHGNKLGDRLDNKMDAARELDKAIKPAIEETELQETPTKKHKPKSRLSLIPLRGDEIEDAEIINKLKQMR